MRTFAALVCLVASIVATAGASLADTIETTGVGTASIEPDRIFIELEVGVKGGSAYLNETVTKSDLTRVLTLIDLADVSQSDILSADIVNPGDTYASNPIIDKRSFGSIVIKLEAPTTIAREHVERHYAEVLRVSLFATASSRA
jgi:uncharacterized protein YggE